MSNILVVFGATGQQGRSIISYVNNELSNKYRIRAVTRDVSKPEAQALEQKGAELVAADLNNDESIKKALKGAHTVFAMTTGYFNDGSKDEFEQGKAIADASVEEKVQYLIWSTLPSATEVSHGKLTHVEHFDFKHRVEQYIRGLPIRSSFFSAGFFMQNFNMELPVLKPQPNGDGSYTIFNLPSPETKVPCIDILDAGSWVGPILAEPEKYEGNVLSAAVDFYTFDEVAQTISKVTGKDVRYQQISVDRMHELLNFPRAINMVELFFMIEKYGFFGLQTKEKVKWSIKQSRGKLTTLEEYFVKNPLTLE